MKTEYDQTVTVISSLEDGVGKLFYCAGCDMVHRVDVDSQILGRNWTWNGDSHKPTFEPSVLVRYEQMSAEGRARCAQFKAQHGRYPDLNEMPYDVHNVCHSFVRDGMIQYLSDCTHRLANNTLPLLPYSQWYGADA